MTKRGISSGENPENDGRIPPPVLPDWKQVGLVCGVALTVRAIYLWEIHRSIFFTLLVGDAFTYDRWAQQIAAGDWLGTSAFYQAPLYPYFLGTLYGLLGRDLLWVRLIQAVLAALSCGALMVATGVWLGRRAAVVAGLLLALQPTALFLTGLLQKSTLDLLFITLLLAAMALSTRNKPWVHLGLAGACLGLLGLTRENALGLLPVLAVWLCLPARGGSWRTRGVNAAVLAVACVAVLLPVALRNLAVAGEPLPTTFQLGANFYIGNHHGSRGIYQPLVPHRSGAASEKEDARELAEQAMGHSLTPAEVSGYWLQRAAGDILAEPISWLGLMARKVRLLCSAEEIMDSDDPAVYRDQSTVLRLLYGLLHHGVVIPVALAGLLLTWRKRSNLQVPLLVMGTLGLTTVVFFVLERYRLPMLPVLAMLCGAALDESLQRVRAGQWRVILSTTAVTCLAAWGANQPTHATHGSTAVAYNNLGVAAAREGRAGEAVTYLRRSLALHPGYTGARLRLATVLLQLGQVTEAEEQYHLLLRQHPSSKEARQGLEQCQRARLAPSVPAAGP